MRSHSIGAMTNIAVEVTSGKSRMQIWLAAPAHNWIGVVERMERIGETLEWSDKPKSHFHQQ